MSDVTLGLRIRVNEDGSVQVLNQTSAALDHVAGSASHASTASSTLNARMAASTAALRDTTAAAAATGSGLVALRGAIAGLGLGMLAKNILDTNIQFESLRSQLTGVMGSSAAGAMAFESSMRWAKATPFELKDITQAFITLKNMGIDPTDKTMESLTNQASRMGKGAQGLATLTMQLGQAWTKGKLQAQDMTIMMEAGVPVMDLLKTITGKTGAVLYDLAEKGELGRDSIKGLIDEMGRLTAGSNEAALDTLKGKISLLSDAWHSFEDTLLQDKSEGLIKSIVDNWAGWINTVTDLLDSKTDKYVQLDTLNRSIATRKITVAENGNKSPLFKSVEQEQRDADERMALAADLDARQLLLKQIQADKLAKIDTDIKNNSVKAIKEWWDYSNEVDADIAAAKEKAGEKAKNASESAAKKAIENAKQQSDALIKAIQSEITAQDEQLKKLTLSDRAYKAHELDLLGMSKAVKMAELAKWDLINAAEAEKKGLDAGKSAMDAEIDRYKQLTLSAHDYYIEKLRSQGVGEQDIPAITAKHEVNTALEARQKSMEDARQALESYTKTLDDTTAKTSDLGAVTSAIFDGALGGVNTLAGAFDNMVEAVDKSTVALEKNHAEKLKIDQFQPSLDREQYLKDLDLKEKAYAKNAKEELRLNDEKTRKELASARQIAGAAAKLFGEKTVAAKAFHAIEIALGVASMAMEAQKVIVYLAGIPAKLAAGASTLFAQSGWGGFAGVVGMAAVMAGLGYAMSSSGGSSAPPPVTSDTGTVLGDPSAVSDSVNRVYQLLEDIHASEYAELRGINQGVASLHSGITNVVTRLFQAGGIVDLNVSLKSGLSNMAKMVDMVDSGLLVVSSPLLYAAKFLIDKIPIIGGITSGITNFLMGGLFGKTTQSIVGGGIFTGPTSIKDIIDGGDLNAAQYATVKTKTKSWFSSKSSYSDVYGALNSDVQAALNNVFSSMGKTMLSLADKLGNGLTDRVNNYVIPAMKVELRGLSGDEAQKKLNGVISATLDAMAGTVFGDILGQYQQLGEGLFETASRIVSEVTIVKYALDKSSLSITSNALAISDALVQAAGGLQEFQKEFENYYDKFYTDTEKQIRLQTELSGALNDVDLALPVTREGYRKLVEALNLSNEADQKRYTLLLAQSSAADSYYKALADQAKAVADNLASIIKTLSDAVTNDKNSLATAYKREANALNDVITKSDGFIKSLTAFRAELTVGNLSTGTPLDKYNALKGQFNDTLAVISTGPGTTAASKLAYDQAMGGFQGVAQAFLSSSREFNASSAAYKNDYQTVMSSIGDGLTSALSTKTGAENQLDSLNNAVPMLISVNDSVLSVHDAIVNLGVSLIGYLATTTGADPVGTARIVTAWYNDRVAEAKNPLPYSIHAPGYHITPDSVYLSMLTRLASGTPIDQILPVQANPVIYGEPLPGHRNGLERVPYDNYIARLHSGERVLTAQESANYHPGLQRMIINMAAHAPAQSSAPSTTEKQLIEQLKLTNKELVDQNKHLSETVRMLKLALPKLIQQNDNQADSLDAIERYTRKAVK